MIIKKPTAADLPWMSLLWQDAFEEKREDVENFYETAFSCDRALVAEMLGAIYWMDVLVSGRRMAYLYAFAVEKDARGKGIGKALLEKTLETLKEEGYAGAILVPGEESLCSYYEKRGFVPFGESPAVVAAGDTDLPAKKITPEEYFALRESFGSKLQWGMEAVSYLGRFCDLYAGKNWLLALGTEGLQEYLGDPCDLPAALYTCQRADGGQSHPRPMAYLFAPAPLPDAFAPVF